jgi:hypothetical protein
MSMAAAATVPRDEGGGEVEVESWSGLLRYAGCALAVAGAMTGFGVAGAIIGCVLLLTL